MTKRKTIKQLVKWFEKYHNENGELVDLKHREELENVSEDTEYYLNKMKLETKKEDMEIVRKILNKYGHVISLHKIEEKIQGVA